MTPPIHIRCGPCANSRKIWRAQSNMPLVLQYLSRGTKFKFSTSKFNSATKFSTTTIPRVLYSCGRVVCVHTQLSRLPGTRIKAVITSTKSCPNQGRCALAHCPDTGTTHLQTTYIATIVRAHLIEHIVQSECSLRYGFDTNWSLRGRPARH